MFQTTNQISVHGYTCRVLEVSGSCVELNMGIFPQAMFTGWYIFGAKTRGIIRANDTQWHSWKTYGDIHNYNNTRTI